MADFDLIGRVRLKLDEASANAAAKRVSEKISHAIDKAVVSPGKQARDMAKLLGIDAGAIAQSKTLRTIARNYESFQERIRRADKLTQNQKKSFLSRGQKLFTTFAKNPDDFLDNFKDEQQLLKQALSRQLDINRNMEKLKKLRKEAKDIEDPKARSGISRSLNVLKKKVQGGDFSSFDDNTRSVAGKIKSAKAGALARVKEAKAIEALDAKEVVDSQKTANKRENIEKQSAAARKAAAAARAREDAEEIAEGQKRFETREADARSSNTARKNAAKEKEAARRKEAKEDAAQIAAGQKRFQEKERSARNSVAATTAARDEEKRFKDNTEDRFKGVRKIVKKIGRSNLEGATKQGLLDQFLPDLFSKGTNSTQIREFTRGLEEFGNAVDKAQDAQRRARQLERDRNKKPPKPPGGGPPKNSLAGDPAFEFGQQSALAARRFAAFSIAAGGLFAVVQAFREGVSESVKFEQQLVKLAQVSNTSISSLGGFRTEIDNLSTSLGISSSDLVDSAVTIRQAGFTLEDTNKALETLALTNLSPSFNDIKNTTEGLIALRSQFGTSADNFKTQFGEINAVSKAFAVESEDIVTAIRKSGGAFKVAGGSVRELISLFTAVRATTRESADTIATGFRTIFGRLQRPQVIDELRAFNIELTDATGKFVGPLKAIKEINKALGDVAPGDLQFARIAEQIGGIRQISKVIPLIQNFATAQRASNIALLGGNSLAEDAEIAQQSLANKLAKTKETFLAFARDITLGDQFKKLASGLLTAAEAFTSFGRTIAPILPLIAAGFAVGQGGNIAKFGAGFINKIGGAGGGANLLANMGGTGPLSRGARFRSGLRRNAPSIAVGAGIATTIAGELIGSGANPITNRDRFVAGRGISEGGAGLIGGALVGGGIGTAFGGPGIGTAVGAALGFAGGALAGFSSAVQDATDALEESKFRPAIDTLTQSLSLVNAGKISPLGQKDNLLSGFNALQNRRLTATGAERDQLNGDVRQTVESLLQFIQVLSESSKTMEAFNAAGGDEAIKFISENSILSGKLLTSQTTDTIEAFQKAEKVARNLTAAQEGLTAQANLISAFGASLADATSKANDMSARFDFVANNLLGAGAVGVQFRGVAGFQDVFSRPGSVNDLNMLSGASRQAAGFLGPDFSGLGGQTVAISDILSQLPSILSEFATKRPSGDITDSLDGFIRDRLNNIAKNIPGGSISLEPIIDSIATSIRSEISQQGKGQTDAIQKILDAPASFVDQIVSGSGFEQVFNLFNDAATRFTERFNTYSNQFAQLTTKEINTREQLVNIIDQRGSRLADVAKIRDPKNFPIGTLRDTRIQSQLALLGPNGDKDLVNNPNAIREKIGQTRTRILEKEAALQKSTEVAETKALIDEIIRLQGETGALTGAFGLAADKSDEIAFKFAEIEKIQLGRDQLRQGFDRFVFGTNAERQQLNQAAVATSAVSADPRLFLNPTVISEVMRGQILDLANTFGERRVPGFFGVNKDGQGKTGNEFLETLRQFVAKQAGAPADILKDLLDTPNDAQNRLLKGIEDLSIEEFVLRQGLILDERDNIQTLLKGIDTSLDDFVRDLRKTLLEQLAQDKQNRIDSIKAKIGGKGGLQEQLNQFGPITALGGSTRGASNLTSLELAKSFRGFQGKDTAIAKLFNDVNGLEGLTGSNLASRFQRNPGLSGLANILSEPLREPGFGDEGVSRAVEISVAEAEKVAKNAFAGFSGELGLDKGTRQSLDKKITDGLSDAAKAQGNRGIVTIAELKDVVVSVFREAAEAARTNLDEKRGAANEQFKGLGGPQQAFVEALTDLPDEKFDAIAVAINKLGDANLDKITEEFNNLNREAGVLGTTLQDLNNKIKGINTQNKAPNAPPAANSPQAAAAAAAGAAAANKAGGGANGAIPGSTGAANTRDLPPDRFADALRDRAASNNPNPIIQRNLDAAARGEAPNQLKADLEAEIERRKRAKESTRAFARQDSKTASEIFNDTLINGVSTSKRRMSDGSYMNGVTNLDGSFSYVQRLVKKAIEIKEAASRGGRDPLHQRASIQSAADLYKNTKLSDDPVGSKILDILVEKNSATLDRMLEQLDRIKADMKIDAKAVNEINKLDKEKQNLKNIPDADFEALRGVLNGFNQGVSAFSAMSPQMIQSMDNFPRTIEMAGNHKVEVVINGAQVLANIQPGIESLVASEIEKALVKFASNNLPGIGSFA